MGPASGTGAVQLISRPFPTAETDNQEKRKESDCRAGLRKQFAMPDIKRELRLDRHFDFTGKHALGKRAACVILKDLSDTTELVDETSHAGVGGTNHRPPRFYRAKYGIGQVLM